MAPRRFTFTRRRDRRAEAPDLGLAPPIEADGAEHSALERRRVSLRWLLGTVLTGFAGMALIGAAIYAAVLWAFDACGLRTATRALWRDRRKAP